MKMRTLPFPAICKNCSFVSRWN